MMLMTCLLLICPAISITDSPVEKFAPWHLQILGINICRVRTSSERSSQSEPGLRACLPNPTTWQPRIGEHSVLNAMTLRLFADKLKPKSSLDIQTDGTSFNHLQLSSLSRLAARWNTVLSNPKYQGTAKHPGKWAPSSSPAPMAPLP